MQETSTRPRPRSRAVTAIMMLALTGESILTATSALAVTKSQSFRVLSSKDNPGGATANIPLAGFCGDFSRSGAIFTFTCTVIAPLARIYLFCTNGNLFAGTFPQGTYELSATPCFA